MSAKYFAILTNLGAAKMANATALGTKLNLTHMAVGDGGGTLQTPNPAQTALRGERRRAALNMLSVDPNNTSAIIAEQVIPESEGGWWVREIGLYDSDGVLIAVANCPETYKPLLQEGSGRTQTIRMVLTVSSTEAVTLKIDPAVVLATRKYVDDKVIEVRSYIDSQLEAHTRSRNHPDATTGAKGFVQLNSNVNSDREDFAATPKAVKIAMDNANARLAKDRHGADIPNKPLFIENLGLGEFVDKAGNAVSKKLIGTIKTGSMAGCDQYGIYEVSVADTSLIPDFPKYNGIPLYGYGVLFVSSIKETGTVTQQYLSHDGVIASRVKWGSQLDFRPWLITYSRLTKPTPQDLSLGNAASKDVGNEQGMVAPGDVTLGVNQTYQDVTSSRVLGVTYTNSLSRPIVVSVKVNAQPSAEIAIIVGGVQAYGDNFSRKGLEVVWLYASAIVPPGSTYSVLTRSGPTVDIVKWVELR
ncbi:phage tail protein [Edwardsiella tarda]|uniref:phage tail protein n=1 Tax=Edwardsiella tarda TaxID=636 RepID=UPI00351C0648